MTLAYYAVPPTSQTRPLGRLKENKRGKRRGELGRRLDSGSEQGGSSRAAASRAAREATCLPGKHRAAFPGRALSKTRRGRGGSHPPNFTVPALEPPPHPAPVPAVGTAGAGKTRADPSRSLFGATAPERIRAPGAESLAAPDTKLCRNPSGGQRPFPAAPARPTPCPAPRLPAALFRFCAAHWASAPPI